MARPSPAEAAAEILRRDMARESLVAFAQAVTIPSAPQGDEDEADGWIYKPVESCMAHHHRLLLAKLQACMEERYGRLMIFMPPGSAKSIYAGVVAPAWAMGRWPGFNLVATSYADKPIHRNSRRCRQIVGSKEYRAIWPELPVLSSSAIDEWGMSNGSTALWKGIDGGITSSRANGVIIDDPVANRGEAESATVMDSRWDEYKDTVKSRLKPGAFIIIIQTRWAPDDLAGRILPEDWSGESGRIMCRDGFEWEVLCIAAKCERKDDPLGRKIGEYLWPEWFDARHWTNFEPNGKDPGLARSWASMYQQRPRPDEGNQFEADWIKWYDPDSLDFKRKPLRYYGASDYAVTEKSASNDPDWTEHGVFGMDPEGDLYGVDWWFDRVTIDEGANAEITLAKRWKVSEWWGARGKDENAVAPMRKRLQRERAARGERGVYYHRDLLPDDKDKIAKVASFRGYVHSGCVYLPLGRPWAIRLADQLCKFRGVDSDQDDGVDVCGLIGRGLAEMRDPAAPVTPEEAVNPGPFTVNQLRREQRDQQRAGAKRGRR